MKRDDYDTLIESKRVLDHLKPLITWRKNKITTCAGFTDLSHWNQRQMVEVVGSLRSTINGIRNRARNTKPLFKDRLSEEMGSAIAVVLDRHRPSLSWYRETVPFGTQPYIAFERGGRNARDAITFYVGLAWKVQVWERIYAKLPKEFGADFMVLRAKLIGTTGQVTIYEVRTASITKVDDRLIKYVDGYLALDFTANTWGLGETVTGARRALDRMNARFVTKRLRAA